MKFFQTCLLAFSTVLLGAASAVAAEAQVPETSDRLASSTIVYGVIPSRCGGLRGVTKLLNHIENLGANTVWLSPIVETPEGDFGYAVTNHIKVNPRLGTEDDLRELISSAHRKNIRVILDMAVNHFSDQHYFYKSAQEKGPDSNYWNFFARSRDDEVTHYFDWNNLKNLNFGNENVRNYVAACLRYWVKEFDVDGFRMDACWGVKQRNPEYWPSCLKRLRQSKSKLFMLAEASALDPYYSSAGFDAAYDWSENLGKWAWETAFRDETVGDLREAIEKSLNKNISVFRFLNNNDTGSRFITKHGEAKTRVAAALLMTLPGVPCIYIGDESGVEFLPYEGHDPIDLEQNEDLRNYYRTLVGMRKQGPDFVSENIAFVDSTSPSVLAYERGVDRPSLVLLNFSATKQSIVLPMHWQSKSVKNIITGVGAKLSAEISLDPLGAYVFKESWEQPNKVQE